MCGVAGSYQQSDGKVVVNTMIDSLGHRGPDACGVLEIVDPTTAVCLAHRRLSIIDLTQAADQPLVKDGLTLSYNGELYNYLVLREELQGAGVRFTTSSDTEVVLEAWRAWGPACLERFRGMFAFAIHDARTGSLTLARDPLGIKPLYVYPRGDGVVFASELKAIVAALGPELRVDPTGMIASTLYYWLPPQHEAVLGVHKLPGGSWTEYRRDGSTTSGVYWDAVEVAAPRRGRTGGRPRVRHRRFGGQAPGLRRAGGLLPQWRPGLEHRHRAGGAPGPVHRGLHDRVPGPGPEARGDARRRALRTQDGRAPRHQAARDRDRARHRGPAAADGRHPRRADR